MCGTQALRIVGAVKLPAARWYQLAVAPLRNIVRPIDMLEWYGFDSNTRAQHCSKCGLLDYRTF